MYTEKSTHLSGEKNDMNHRISRVVMAFWPVILASYQASKLYIYIYIYIIQVISI